MRKLITCQCGVTVRGANDDELIANVQKHADEVHGGMKLPREQVLAMAQPDPGAA
jgi:predicted small metal-binding protein